MEWLKGILTVWSWVKKMRDVNWREVIKGNDVKYALLIAAIVLAFYATVVAADTRFYAGVGYEARGNTAPTCHNSQWTGEIGVERDFRLPLAGQMVGAFEHNSCFDEEDDKAVSDRLMIKKVWTFK